MTGAHLVVIPVNHMIIVQLVVEIFIYPRANVYHTVLIYQDFIKIKLVYYVYHAINIVKNVLVLKQTIAPSVKIPTMSYILYKILILMHVML